MHERSLPRPHANIHAVRSEVKSTVLCAYAARCLRGERLMHERSLPRPHANIHAVRSEVKSTVLCAYAAR